MNEPTKHIIWISGLVGSISLEQVNALAGIFCGVAGGIYACYQLRKAWQRDHQNKRRK